jgi:hypothetical protein
MICFIMGLKARAICKDWPRVESLASATLHSVCQQTDQDFSVIVVCNEIPRTTLPSGAPVTFIAKDFPLPGGIAGHENGLDKFRKLAHGLAAAREMKPDFVMLMDADDLVSRRLAEFANSNKASNGWMFETGYAWKYGGSWVTPVKSGFHKACGTSAIINSRLINFPAEASDEALSTCIVLANGHTTICDTLARQGAPLDVLPFPGALYVTDHGDNGSLLAAGENARSWISLRFWLGSLRQRRYLSPAIRAEFGLQKNVRRAS